nr:MAG TPA: hypothetical protein [Caudoviricetes sp.]
MRNVTKTLIQKPSNFSRRPLLDRFTSDIAINLGLLLHLMVFPTIQPVP